MNPSPATGSGPAAVKTFVDPATGVKGWLVIDTTIEGLSFGGFRFQPSVTQEQVAELARCMTWKLAAHGLPVGGAKAGLAIQPQDPGLPEILARFGSSMREHLKASVILGKDMGATDELIDGLYRHLEVPQLHAIQARRAGEEVPDRLRDLRGYCEHMTGRGVAVAARAALGGSLDGCRIAIQGFGLVGAGTAFRAGAMGAQIVAMSDAHTALAGQDLPLAELTQRALVTREIDRELVKSQARFLSRDDLLALDVDLLVLAAGSHSVDADLAARIQARHVVEGANFALLPEARQVLQSRGIVVIPDLIANSASAALVTRQMAASNTIGADEVWQRIEDAIEKATLSAMDGAEADGVDLRMAHLKAISVDG